jgi:hypothetical protein
MKMGDILCILLMKMGDILCISLTLILNTLYIAHINSELMYIAHINSEKKIKDL